MYLAAQTLRAEKENGRWVVIPQEDFWTAETSSLIWGCDALPAYRYEAQAEGFTVCVEYQTVHTVDSYIQSDDWSFPSSFFDTTPQPHAEFSVQDWEELYVIYTGSPADKDEITSIGASLAPISKYGSRPELRSSGTGSFISGSSSDGSLWGVQATLGEDWGPEIWLGGGGSSGLSEDFTRPEAYAADLYLNGEKAAELTLLPAEGGRTS